MFLKFVLFATICWILNIIPTSAQIMRTESISLERASAKYAEVSLKPSVARLQVEALERPSLAMNGMLRLVDDEELIRRLRVQEETAIIRLEGRRSKRNQFRNEEGGVWQIGLNPSLPLSLEVDSGVGEVNLDLTAFTLRKLNVNCGVGSSVIQLPQNGSFDALIDTGVGELTLRVPESLNVYVTVSAGLGSISASGAFEQHENGYRSVNFEEASERAHIVVSSGVGSIYLERIP